MKDLFRIAEDAGITVEYCRLPLNGSVSIADREGDFVLMDYALISSPSMERVHLAHELGHCMTGSFYSPYAVADLRKKHEARADRWAIKKLVPMDEFWKALARGITEMWDLAEYFGVTEDFMRKAVCYYQAICPVMG